MTSDDRAAAAAHRSRGMERARSRVAALVPAARAWIGRPWDGRASLTYVLILAANRVVMASLESFSTPRGRPLPLDTLVLRAVSTNLARLRADPFDVLVASAFFTTSTWSVIAFAAVAVVLLVPLERRIGPGRWVATFAAGHVGATLIVAVGLALAVDTREVARTAARTIDVGMSYGLGALLGVAAVWLLDGRRTARALAVAALVGATVAGVALGRTFTDWGHLVAVLIGLALGAAFVAGRPASGGTGEPGGPGAVKPKVHPPETSGQT